MEGLLLSSERKFPKFRHHFTTQKCLTNTSHKLLRKVKCGPSAMSSSWSSRYHEVNKKEVPRTHFECLLWTIQFLMPVGLMQKWVGKKLKLVPTFTSLPQGAPSTDAFQILEELNYTTMLNKNFTLYYISM